MEALERYQEALEIFQALQDPGNVAETFNELGILFRKMGAYDLAKDALIQSVQIAESIGDEMRAADNYNALGGLSWNQFDFISAKTWYEKALSIYENLHDETNAAIARRNLENAIATIIANGGAI